MRHVRPLHSRSHREPTRRGWRNAGNAGLACLLLAGVCAGFGWRASRVRGDGPDVTSHASVEATDRPRISTEDRFTFVRVRYRSTGGFGESWYRHEGRNWQRWETDYPRAEKNLLLRLDEITSLQVNPEPIVLDLEDDAIFDHPFLFMSDVGWQTLSARETKNLIKFLDRGGFLWVDDFWGEAEWKNFLRNFGELRADWNWSLIPEEHPLLTSVYPLKACPQIPARIFFERTGLPHDPPGIHRYPSGGIDGVKRVHFMGLFDETGQLLGVATHNTDIADGWEREGESQGYFEQFSIPSYAITINILVYAMTH